MKQLLAIDPGTTESALLIWNGAVQFAEIAPNEAVRQRIIALASNDQDMEMAIEGVQCFGMSVGKEVFETCYFIGRLQEVWLGYARPMHLVYRQQVKLHICGTPRAKDPNIRQALIDRYGIVGTKKNKGPLFGISSHLWSALAIATYVWDTKNGKPDTTRVNV